MFVIRKVLWIAGVTIALPLQLQAQTPSLKAFHRDVQKPKLYELTLTLPDTLSAGAALRIGFPDRYDLSAVQIAGSNHVNGGLSFFVDSLAVVIRRSGLGDPVPAGKMVSIVFGPIGGVPAPADSAEVVVFTQGLSDTSSTHRFRIPIR